LTCYHYLIFCTIFHLNHHHNKCNIFENLLYALHEYVNFMWIIFFWILSSFGLHDITLL
jgi:hypothetical protein